MDTSETAAAGATMDRRTRKRDQKRRAAVILVAMSSLMCARGSATESRSSTRATDPQRFFAGHELFTTARDVRWWRALGGSRVTT